MNALLILINIAVLVAVVVCLTYAAVRLRRPIWWMVLAGFSVLLALQAAPAVVPGLVWQVLEANNLSQREAEVLALLGPQARSDRAIVGLAALHAKYGDPPVSTMGLDAPPCADACLRAMVDHRLSELKVVYRGPCNTLPDASRIADETEDCTFAISLRSAPGDCSGAWTCAATQAGTIAFRSEVYTAGEFELSHQSIYVVRGWIGGTVIFTYSLGYVTPDNTPMSLTVSVDPHMWLLPALERERQFLASASILLKSYVP